MRSAIRSRRASIRARAATTVVLAMTIALAACSSGGSTGASGTSTSEASASEEAGSKEPVIAVALIAPVDLLEDNIAAFKAELEAQGYSPTYTDYNAQGQISNVGTIVNQIVDLEPDLVYAVGTPINIAVQQQLPETPQVFGAMTDPVGAGVVKSLEKPGGTATGTTGAVPAATTFDILTAALPDVARVGIIGNQAEPNTVATIEDLTAEAKNRGIALESRAVASTADVASAIRSLEGIEALLIPGDNTVVSAIATVAQTADELDIPTFDPYGAALAKQGITVAFGPDYDTLGTAAAEQAAQILAGDASPDSLPVVGLGNPGIENQIFLNQASADRVGLTVTPKLKKQISQVIQ